jgi:hypothetical protein
MGKMLEVFKQANPRANPPTIPVSPSTLHHGEKAGDEGTWPALAVATHAISADVPAEEIPFIEVGGRNTAIEASPTVLASGPVARPRSVLPAARPVPVYRSVRLDPPAGAKPRWFAFQPRFATELIAVHDVRHSVSSQYESLLHQILGPIANKPVLIVWFLGSAPRCGTTTIVLNLALTATRLAESPVTIVEANSRRPAMAQRVGLPSDSGGVAWFQAIKPTNLRFVARGDSPRLALPSILEMLQGDEGLILVDGPSLDDVADLKLVDLPCDAVYGVTSSPSSGKPIGDLGRPIDGWVVSQA